MPLKLASDEPSTVNLTPMIDVVFLLVIFFMVATKFTEVERSIDLELPTAAEAGDSLPPDRPSVVAVREGGQVELDGAPVTLDELTARLRGETEQQSDKQLVIHGDARASFQHVAAAMAACQQGGVSELSITIEIAARGGPTRR